jgi:hypothetical protein
MGLFSKKDKELESVINQIRVDLSNNYKDNAVENIKKLEPIKKPEKPEPIKKTDKVVKVEPIKKSEKVEKPVGTKTKSVPVRSRDLPDLSGLQTHGSLVSLELN